MTRTPGEQKILLFYMYTKVHSLLDQNAEFGNSPEPDIEELLGSRH